MTGQVKMFNDVKGYGFIEGDDGEEYFMHISNVKSQAELTKGQRVEFTASKNKKGKEAKNVIVEEKKIKGEPVRSMVSKAISKRSAVLILGDHRIKVRDIMTYGISKGKKQEKQTELYIKIYERERYHNRFEEFLGYEGDFPRAYKWYGLTMRLSELMEFYMDWESCISANDITTWKYRLIGTPKIIKKRDGTIEKVVEEDQFSYQFGDSDRAIYGKSGDRLTLFMTDDDFVIKTISPEKYEKYLYIETYQKENFQFWENNGRFDIYKKCEEIDSYMN